MFGHKIFDDLNFDRGRSQMEQLMGIEARKILSHKFCHTKMLHAIA
jgi:hypothetical protein